MASRNIQSKDLKWIGVDFDDCVAHNSGPPDYDPTVPLEGAKDNLIKLTEDGFKITIFTARAWSHYSKVERWLKENDIPFRRIICGKPLFRYYLDDRNIAFNNWDKMYEEIQRKGD